jgi:hypothetical protein
MTAMSTTAPIGGLIESPPDWKASLGPPSRPAAPLMTLPIGPEGGEAAAADDDAGGVDVVSVRDRKCEARDSVVRSHTPMALSEPVTTQPSGSEAMAVTASLWPYSECRRTGLSAGTANAAPGGPLPPGATGPVAAAGLAAAAAAAAAVSGLVSVHRVTGPYEHASAKQSQDDSHDRRSTGTLSLQTGMQTCRQTGPRA